MSKVTIKWWCDKCNAYTDDNEQLHNDRHITIVGADRLPIECNDNDHKFVRWWTGSDTLFMACTKCPVQYDIATDPAGDFSGASYDIDGGR